MRINENLEKKLLELEVSGKDNLLNILDVATALENVYDFINESMIKDEKGFDIVENDFRYVKERYDAINGKTIYNVKTVDSEDVLFNIEISNLGEISFAVIGANKEEIERLIDKVNEPSNNVLEMIKMNADISFFTENRELVLSTKPYIAIKMGNFVEGNKAVIVYKEEQREEDINKTNTGLKYLRVDQIEGYLKNIKVDERKVPVLAYAYLGRDFTDQLKYNRYLLEESTYPKLTEEKVNYFTDSKYYDKLFDATLSFGLGGGFALGFAGAIIGGVTALPFWPCLLVGAGLPVASSVIVYRNRCKQIERSEQKEELVANAKLGTYSVIKKYANENISYKEAEFTRSRAKKNRKIIGLSVSDKVNNTEVIKSIKSSIDDVELLKRPFLNIMLMHIIDSYTKNDSQNKETELYAELIKLNDEIDNIEETKFVDLVNTTLSTIQRTKVDYNTTLSSLDSLLSATDKLAAQRSAVQSVKDKLTSDIVKAEAETMLETLDEGKILSVETVASLSSYNKFLLNDMLNKFGDRIGYFNDQAKKVSSSEIKIIDARDEPKEVKIIKMLNVISENKLISDLLGKDIKKSSKVKELK